MRTEIVTPTGPPVNMEVVVVGDPTTPANLAAVDLNGNLKSLQKAQLGQTATTTWNSATPGGSALGISTAGMSTVIFEMSLSGAFSAGKIGIIASRAGLTTFIPFVLVNNTGLSALGPFYQVDLSTIATGIAYTAIVNCAGYAVMEPFLSIPITGAGTVTLNVGADATTSTAQTISPLGEYVTTVPALTNYQTAPLQLDTAANLRVNPYGNIGSFTTIALTGSAGSQVTLQVPVGKKWLLKGGSLQLVTNATAANRNILFNARDAATNQIAQSLALASVSTLFAQTASLTIIYSFAPAYTYYQTTVLDNQMNFPFPELVLGPGFTLNSNIQNIQAGDLVTVIVNVIQISD
jgi:hypothetical protein